MDTGQDLGLDKAFTKTSNVDAGSVARVTTKALSILKYKIFLIWNSPSNMECGDYYDMSKSLKHRIWQQYKLDIPVCLKQKIFLSYHVLTIYLRIFGFENQCVA